MWTFAGCMTCKRDGNAFAISFGQTRNRYVAITPELIREKLNKKAYVIP